MLPVGSCISLSKLSLYFTATPKPSLCSSRLSSRIQTILLIFLSFFFCKELKKGLDSIAFVVLLIDVVIRIHMARVGLNPSLDGSKVIDHMTIFDVGNVFLLFLSILLQVISVVQPDLAKESYSKSSTLIPEWISKVYLILCRIARCPRPLLMVWVVRSCTSLKLPSQSSYSTIFRRAGQQIWGVTLFLFFFLVFYGIVGVQLFGKFENHCVKPWNPAVDVNETTWAIRLKTGNITYSDLAIPDRYCNLNEPKCPRGFVCKSVGLKSQQTGFSGFDNIVTSVKTVYVAASQEGWVFMMYKTIDAYDYWLGYLYFISLIFFLAWLVKNVFIAVIIECLAEVRVQMNNVWGSALNHTQNAWAHPVFQVWKKTFQFFFSV